MNSVHTHPYGNFLLRANRVPTTALLCLIGVLLVGSITPVAQDGPSARNFDRRLLIDRTQPPVSASALRSRLDTANDARDGFPSALLSDFPDLDLSVSELDISVDNTTGVTTRIYNRLGYLTETDLGDRREIALRFVLRNIQVLGLDQQDLTDYEFKDVVRNQATGSTHVYLGQRHLGISVYNALLQVNISRDGRIISVNNSWVPGLAEVAGSALPEITAVAAVSRAAESLALEVLDAPRSLSQEEGPAQLATLAAPGISIEPVNAVLMWLPIHGWDVRLVWSFQVHTPDGEHAYDMTVDANTGDVWTRFDWVAADSYRVFPAPAENPLDSSAGPVADGRTLVEDPADAVASPYGWHDTNGVEGAEHTIMRGNNVHAYRDDDANDSPPTDEPDCGADLECDFSIDFAKEPSESTDAAVANLFYWSNYIHDVQYRYGFTETAGNFQVNNYGRGGKAGDPVLAEAQDGKGTGNALFHTPPDGQSPRMEMFLWLRNVGPRIDGDFDSGIIVHEYGHGISNRLVGGPSNTSCLHNRQQPGEGLSDWYALAYTAKAQHTGTDRRGIGAYASGGPTIRSQFYSTDPRANGWTYESINGRTGEHSVGEVWAQAAWEMYWALVDEHGFDGDLSGADRTAGNKRAMLYVTQGLMNTSCSPTFIDVRDGILQAAIDNHGGEDVCRLWESFAGFGLGVDAVSGGSDMMSPARNGYEVPGACSSGQ